MKRMITVLVLVILLMMCSACAEYEHALLIPDGLMHVILNEKNYETAAEQFLSYANNSESVESEKRVYGKNKEYPRFDLDNICIDGNLYKTISGSFGPTTDGRYSYSYTLEHERPFGEKIEESTVFINTVNEYKKKYKQLPLDEVARFRDEYSNIVSFHWRDVESGAKIILEYHNGDVSEGRFPRIEIMILGAIE